MKKINHLAVIITAIIHQVLGFLWYSPWLFERTWLAGFGLNKEELNQANPTPFIFAFLASLTFCYLFAWLLNRLGIRRIQGGMLLALMLWFPLVGLGTTSHLLFAQIPWSAVWVEIGGILVNFVVTGLIVTAWRPKRRSDSLRDV